MKLLSTFLCLFSLSLPLSLHATAYDLFSMIPGEWEATVTSFNGMQEETQKNIDVSFWKILSRCEHWDALSMKHNFQPSDGFISTFPITNIHLNKEDHNKVKFETRWSNGMWWDIYKGALVSAYKIHFDDVIYGSGLKRGVVGRFDENGNYIEEGLSYELWAGNLPINIHDEWRFVLSDELKVEIDQYYYTENRDLIHYRHWDLKQKQAKIQIDPEKLDK